MITIIVAQDEQNAIGKNNDLPWPRIKEDMKFFRDQTFGHPVIMGRKTFESLPHGNALEGRLNIVLSFSHTGDGELEEQETKSAFPTTYLSKVDSLEKAFAIADAYNEEHKDDRLGSFTQKTDTVFIIGGSEIYNASLRYADRILLTRVVGTYEADVFLSLGLSDWVLESSQPVERDGELICTFESYKRVGSLTEATTE